METIGGLGTTIYCVLFDGKKRRAISCVLAHGTRRDPVSSRLGVLWSLGVLAHHWYIMRGFFVNFALHNTESL